MPASEGLDRAVCPTSTRVVDRNLFVGETSDRVIRELRSYAAEEHADVSTASEAALIQFMGSCSDTGEASFFLPLENGRFTARWVSDRSRLSIEFLGDDAVEYVVLWERADGSWDGVSRETTIDQFWDAYQHMEVEHLLRRGSTRC